MAIDSDGGGGWVMVGRGEVVVGGGIMRMVMVGGRGSGGHGRAGGVRVQLIAYDNLNWHYVRSLLLRFFLSFFLTFSLPFKSRLNF